MSAQVVDVFTLANGEIGAGLFAMCIGIGLCLLNPLAGIFYVYCKCNISVISMNIPCLCLESVQYQLLTGPIVKQFT